MAYGIKETKEAVLFGFVLASALKESLKDGRVGIGDLPKVFRVLQAAPEALANLSKVPAELSDLTSEEYDELVSAVEPYLEGLVGDEVQTVIILALDTIKKVGELIGAIK